MIRRRGQFPTCCCEVGAAPRAWPTTASDPCKSGLRTASCAHDLSCGAVVVGNSKLMERSTFQGRRSLKVGKTVPRYSPWSTTCVQGPRRQQARRPPAPAWTETMSFSAVLVLTASAVLCPVRADITTDYFKPIVSSKGCMETVGLITAKTKTLGNDGACMQCDPATKICPPACQPLIDNLYVDCDGVSTPDGLFFDPNNSISGEWSEKVKAKIKIATERCGCDSSVRSAPLATTTFFKTSIAGSLGLAGLISLVSWFVASMLLLVPDDDGGQARGQRGK